MSVVRFPARPPRIVKAWLIPWEPGIPGIAYLYNDGLTVTADATVLTPGTVAAIKRLPPAERERLEGFRAVHRS